MVPRRLSPGASGGGDTYGGYRARLVETLRVQGIRDLAVLKAFAEIPRHLFVPEAVRHRAYEDVALPIGNGQTISQPFTQARYLAALRLTGREKVLEIGTGSGYQTALLGALAATVFSVERVETLARAAQQALRLAGATNVSVLHGDGTLGWSAYAPYDAILVAAGGPEVPRPLVEQLAPRGRLLIPVGARGAQTLTLVERAVPAHPGAGQRHRQTGRFRWARPASFPSSENTASMLESFIHWLLERFRDLGYPGIVILMAIESSFLPLPSELVMPPAGYLAAKGELSFVLAIACGVVGSILGALANYGLAHWLGRAVVRRIGKYVWISEKSLERSERYFAEHGEISTFMGRMLPVVRHLISIPAGVANMNLAKFITFTLTRDRAGPVSITRKS